MSETIRIIGIDPGLRRTGWGVIEAEGNQLRFVASGMITTRAQASDAERLVRIHEGLLGIVATHQPVEAAVEATFVNKNPKASLKLGQARGIALLVPALEGLQIWEYAPNQVKKTVVGAGHSDKAQIRVMVSILLPRARFESDDAADALAIALCHAQHRRVPAHAVP